MLKYGKPAAAVPGKGSMLSVFCTAGEILLGGELLRRDRPRRAILVRILHLGP